MSGVRFSNADSTLGHLVDSLVNLLISEYLGTGRGER